MNNQKYWEERAILKDKLLFKYINKLEKKILSFFKNAKKNILNEVKIFHTDMQITEYAKYQIDNTLTNINSIIDNLYYKKEEEVLNAFSDVYYEFDKEANNDLNIKDVPNYINKSSIKDVINDNWSGVTLDKRIKEHKRKLSFSIEEELNKGLIRGDSLKDIAKRISDKVDIAYSNAIRLVRTESCRIVNEATINNYKNNGIEKYQIMAFLDNKTSKICRDMDGEVVNVEEAIPGKNLPPFH